MTVSTNPSESGLADLAASEYPFTRDDFQRIADLLRADVGIALTETKAPLVYARLVSRLRALGLESFKAYCTLIHDDANGDERRKMSVALTTNVTRFFREPHHFEHLKTSVLPSLLKNARQGGRVRLWSAGCSSGEEPYSIAMTVLSLLPDAANYDIKILATDIDTTMLDVGRAGLYSEALMGPVDAALRETWFTRTQSDTGQTLWKASDQLRELVAFRELNLMDSWPMRGPFQVVFCRNTVIYFDDGVQVSVWGKIAPLVSTDGVLYVGHSERVTSTDDFRPIGLTAYARTKGR